tara:strand:- start:146 stop:370 length:225 start_codon:yes stop_codon:yes gene_type:complete
MEGLKLMKKMSPEEYHNLINNSTYISNLNKGNVIDHSRYLLTQKMETFEKLKSAEEPNFMADQTRAQSNYGRVK